MLKSLFTMCQSHFDAIEGCQKRMLKKMKKIEETQKAICIQSKMAPLIESSEEEEESDEVPAPEDPFASFTAEEYAFFDTPFPAGASQSGASPSAPVEEEADESTSYETEESDELARARKQKKKARTSDGTSDRDFFGDE